MTEPDSTHSPVAGSGRMFDGIARRYDRMNRILSFGLDRNWRRKLIDSLGPMETNRRVLDVATGTGDVAIDIATRSSESTITGLDPSQGMLNVGREKVERLGLSSRIQLTNGDAQALPFEDNTFDATCIAFGIRNVPDRKKGIEEMVRVVRPEGRIAVLELSEPRGGILSGLARLHVHHIVPVLGAMLSGSREYRYLQRSIAAFPPPDDFADLMRACGCRKVEIQRMSFGTAHLYIGTV